jgi:uncharacterized protein YjbI with pentapeptide repeats
MANQRHLKILKEGVDAWNQWREAHPRIVIELSGADLSEAELSRVDLSEARLDSADLSAARLNNANLAGANLTMANLTAANLEHANLHAAYLVLTDFGGADLGGANLSRADLRGANLTLANLHSADLAKATLAGAILIDTNLDQADLSEAYLAETVLGNTSLANVKGLDSCGHWAPSIVDYRTLQRSGNLPLPFLRGCGLPEALIESLPSLLKQPRFYSCFISYSSRDEDFAQLLYSGLQSEGVRCWFDRHDMKTGDEIRPTIDEAIHTNDKLLIVLSKNSIRSQWVKKEVETAFEEEQKRRETILLPIRLDESVMRTSQAWAADIRRTRHIGDFQSWGDPREYRAAFERFLEDLRVLPKPKR